MNRTSAEDDNMKTKDQKATQQSLKPNQSAINANQLLNWLNISHKWQHKNEIN